MNEKKQIQDIIRKIRVYLGCLLVSPTWLLVNTNNYFHILTKNHPWKNKYFTLIDWYSGATSLTKQFSFLLWLLFLCVIVLITKYQITGG